MSFHTYQRMQTNKRRKEKDRVRSCHQRIRERPTKKERASLCTLRGSLTIEASLVVPFFVFALMSFIWLFEITTTKLTVKNALASAGKEMATESILGTIGLSGRIEKKMVEHIGEERLAKSCIQGGSSGLDCAKSRTYPGTTIMKLTVSYKMQLPVIGLALPILKGSEEILVKGWTGYEGSGFYKGTEKMVYVTATGLVYHKDLKCTHLDLSIRSVRIEDAKKVYPPCSKCRWSAAGSYVYVTDYGEHYHTTLSCSGLKRSVYAVPISEVYTRGGCERCVK